MVKKHGQYIAEIRVYEQIDITVTPLEALIPGASDPTPWPPVTQG